MEILLVDDERHILQVIGDFLEDCGYQVCTAGNGAEALQVLEQKGDVGLVVSDIRMPRLDGLGLLKAARVRFPGIPVVLMTGHGDEDVAAAALHEGAHNYLKKPIKLNEFLDCVEQVEARSRLESQVLDEFQQGRDAQASTDVEPPEETADDLRVASVLIVDPEKETRHELEGLLRSWGNRVQTASSAAEGLERFAEGLFDLVITAIELPDTDGVGLIRQLRALDPTAMPLAVAAMADQQTAVRVLEEGGRGLLVRPFAAEELRRQVARILRERKRLVDARLLLGDLLQTRAELREQVVERERFLSHLIDAAPFGIVSTDQQGNILTFNGRAEEMYGFGPEEVAGQPLVRLGFAENRATGDGPQVAKVQQVRKNGETFPALVHCRDVLDHRNRCIARLHVVEDLTEREQMEEQLFYAERLSLLGQLAPRIAHEYKTPLQVIVGQVELAMMEMNEGKLAEARQYMEDILPATQQMVALTQQIANLGKPEKSRVTEVDLREEMEKTLDGLKNLGVAKYCRIHRDFVAELPAIHGDPAQIQQVFRNLVVNAAQAMEGTHGREIHLGLRVAAPDAVEVAVRDSGPGIGPEKVERIFEPFFTTKPEGKGTGLGLSIVKSIMDRHGGDIEVESQVGQGTCFRLSFPVPETAAAGEAEGEGQPSGEGRHREVDRRRGEDRRRGMDRRCQG